MEGKLGNDLSHNTVISSQDQHLDSSHAAARESNQKALIVLSNFFSGVFLPLLVPTYSYAIALWTTPLSHAQEKVRLISSIVVFALTALIPLATIMFLMKKGKVSDVSIDNRRERTVPYLVTILCYLITALYLWLMPRWLPMFFVGAAVSAFIASLITFKYKISAHSTSMGGLCALIIYIGMSHIATVLIIPWVSAGILLSGAVGSARLYLGRHTPSQVYSGWLLGLTVTYLLMSI